MRPPRPRELSKAGRQARGFAGGDGVAFRPCLFLRGPQFGAPSSRPSSLGACLASAPTGSHRETQGSGGGRRRHPDHRRRSARSDPGRGRRSARGHRRRPVARAVQRAASASSSAGAASPRRSTSGSATSRSTRRKVVPVDPSRVQVAAPAGAGGPRRRHGAERRRRLDEAHARRRLHLRRALRGRRTAARSRAGRDPKIIGDETRSRARRPSSIDKKPCTTSRSSRRPSSRARCRRGRPGRRPSR